MKLITRHTDYAIRALIYMAQKPKALISVAELAVETGIPKAFLRGILQKLSHNHVLTSIKGKGGGFLLNKPVKNINITSLIKIFQGTTEINECMFKKNLCPNRNNCSLRRKISSIEEKVLKELEATTIASLIKK